jgi:hypothetical protein
MNERIRLEQERIKKRENMNKKNRLISYSNQISKNLFEKDEEINRTTQLMWNRDYEETINEACKVWTSIMIIDKPEMIFAKVKIRPIMIESTLNQVLSHTKDAEGWLGNNRIMTAILNIKMMIRLKEDKEEICNQIIDTLKRIETIEYSGERNDWYTQREELNEIF